MFSLPTLPPAPNHRHICSVPSCSARASFKVYLLDDRPGGIAPFRKSDRSCPFLCQPHAEQNEQEATGGGRMVCRSSIRYPFTKQNASITGFTRYTHLDTGVPVPMNTGGVTQWPASPSEGS